MGDHLHRASSLWCAIMGIVVMIVAPALRALRSILGTISGAYSTPAEALPAFQA